MHQVKPVREQSASLAAGVKVAVVILGVLAALVDQSIVLPREPILYVPESRPVAITQPATDGFALPEHLRANSGDVTPQVDTF